MTAKEFIEKEALGYKLAEYDEGGFIGIDECLLEQKLEEYHKAKLKLLGIANVVKSFVCPNGCGKNGDVGSCIECVGK